MGCVNFFKYHPDATLDQYCKKFKYDRNVLAEMVKKTEQYSQMSSEIPEEKKIMTALFELDNAKMTDVIYKTEQTRQQNQPQGSWNFSTYVAGQEQKTYDIETMEDTNPTVHQPSYLMTNEMIDDFVESMEDQISIYADMENFEYVLDQFSNENMGDLDDEKRRMLMILKMRKIQKNVRMNTGSYQSKDRKIRIEDSLLRVNNRDPRFLNVAPRLNVNNKTSVKIA
jgi:hypothetical protein